MWHEQFLRFLTSKPGTSEDFEEAILLKNSNIPQKLYKYRSINNFTLDSLNKNTVWVTRPSNYNDPYDCCFTWSHDVVTRICSRLAIDQMIYNTSVHEHLNGLEIDMVKRDENPLDAIGRILWSKSPDKTKKTREMFDTAIQEMSKKIELEHKTKMMKFVRESIKTSSFSERNDSITMWSHYSDNHRGICVEYDFSRLNSNDLRRRLIYPIIYTNSLFDSTSYFVDHFSNKPILNNFLIIAAIHKSIDWAYEHEWRFVMPLGDKIDDMNFIMPVPSKIMLGSEISKSNIDLICNIASQQSIPVSMMTLSRDYYSIVEAPPHA